jgi:hypothetical protein
VVYPQPLKGDSCHIAFELPGPGDVNIKIWNAKGDLVSEVRERKVQSGLQACRVATAAMSPGVYFFRVECRLDGGGVHKFKAGKFMKSFK